jgi:hypothetical protein
MDELEKYDLTAFLMLCPDKLLIQMYKDLEEEYHSMPPGYSRGIYISWAICEIRDRMNDRGLDY